MPSIASKEWTKDLLKKSLAAFTPSEESDAEFGVGERIDNVEDMNIEFSKDGHLTIGEDEYGYIKTSKEINEILINKMPTTVLLIGTVEGISYYRARRTGIGSVLFELI